MLKTNLKRRGARIKRICLIGALGLLSACAHTVIPDAVHAKGASYSGGKRNSGIVQFVASGVVFDAHSRDRYNELIKSYGTLFTPALKADAGLTAKSDGTWLIDNEHFAKAVQMNTWRRSGVEPQTKSLIDKVIDIVK